jgi:hypothetical protein
MRDKLLNKLKKIKEPFKKRLFFVGILTEKLKDYNIKPILVGGNAVEFYTLGSYSTEDIDIVCYERDKVDKLLKDMNFNKVGRYWINGDLDIVLEIPDDKLSGNYSKIKTIEIEDLTVYIIGIEDLIIDRLNSCVHWKYSDDCEWAKELILLNKKIIDFTYLEKMTKKEEVYDTYRRILDEIDKI